MKQAIFDMVRVDGYTTFDVAPFYGQVERWLGEVRLVMPCVGPKPFPVLTTRHRAPAIPPPQVRAKIEDPFERDAYRVFTKLAFPPLLPTDRIGRAEVEKEVDACLARLKAGRLDLLQLHWWDFEDPRYLDVLHYLAELKDKGGWVCRHGKGRRGTLVCISCIHLTTQRTYTLELNAQARSGTWA